MNPMKSVRFGLKFGVLVSALISIGMTLWNWLENPSGVFHGPEGTHWWFLLETLTSWLLPTFVYAAFMGLLGHLIASWVRHNAGKGRAD